MFEEEEEEKKKFIRNEGSVIMRNHFVAEKVEEIEKMKENGN